MPSGHTHITEQSVSDRMTESPRSEYRGPAGIVTCKNWRYLAIVFRGVWCPFTLRHIPLQCSSGPDIGWCIMLSIMRADAKIFVNELVEQMYGDVDRIETQIVMNQQEDPLIVPVLLSIQKKMREFLRLVEEEAVNLEEAAS
jgi:hypothetical protein